MIADQLALGTVYADITSLSMAMAASTDYAFEFHVLADADAVTTGIDIAVNGPTGAVLIRYEQMSWTSTSAFTLTNATAYDTNTGNLNSNGATTRWYHLKGLIRNGTTPGNLVARAKREAVGAGPNIRAGSYGILIQVS